MRSLVLVGSALAAAVLASLTRWACAGSDQPADSNGQSAQPASAPDSAAPVLPQLACTLDANCRIQSVFMADPQLIPAPIDIAPGTALQNILPAPAAEIIRSELAALATPDATASGAYSLPDQTGQRWYTFHVTRDHAARFRLLIHDVTSSNEFDQRRTQELLKSEHEQRLIAQTLNEIFIILAGKHSKPEVMAEILKQLERVIPFKTGTLAQIDGNTISLLAWRGDKDFGQNAVEYGFGRYQFSDFANLRKAVQTRQPLVIGDTFADPDWVRIPESPWIRSHITYPIVFQGNILGLILLDSDQTHAFSEADLERLGPMINAVAIILKNAQLYERSQQEIVQRKQAEAALQQANLLLSQHVTERTAELEAEIVERRRAEALLRESEERFRSAFTNAPIGLAVVDLNGHYLQANRALCEMLGYDNGYLEETNFAEFTPPEGIPISQQALQHLATQGGVLQYKERYLQRGGALLNIIVNASSINDEQGTPVSIVAQFQDVTTEKHGEEENARLLETLRHRNTLLRTAAAVSTSASSILSPQELTDQAVHLIQKQFQYYYVGLFLKDKAGHYAVLRAGTGDAGRRMIEEGHRLQLNVHNSMIAACITLNEPRIALDVGLNPARYSNPYLPHTRSEMALPLSTPSNGCIGGLTVHSQEPAAFTQEDIAALRTMAEQIAIAIENARLYNAAREEITGRMKAERALKQLNESLERRVAERTAELAAANRELEAFAYSVSHDLRAPIRRITGFTQAVLEDYSADLDSDGQEYLNRVVSASQHMNGLIDALLNLSRVTRAEIHRETIDLSHITEAICQTLHQNAPARQATFNIAPGLVAHGDPHLLRTMLENLIGNAWKFTSQQAHTRITVGATPQEQGTAIFVRDNGTGFDMAYAERLFAAFQRLHADDEFEGSGIGLATVQRIVHRHGGRVWAEGEPGKGATFFFALPS